MTDISWHPSVAELIMFQDPSLAPKERAPLAEHMKECSSCRDRLSSILALKNSFTRFPEDTSPVELTGECVPMELMADFLGGRLPLAERAGYSAHTDRCDICFERAAYFSHSSMRMTEGALRMEKTPLKFMLAVAPGLAPSARKAEEKRAESAAVRAWRWFTSPIPAYAFAATLFLFLAFGGRGPELVDLGSHQTFSIYEPAKSPGPSFGFSDAGRKVGEEQAGLAVRMKGDTLNFDWNRVEGAGEYRLVISELDPSGAREIVDVKTLRPGAELNISQFGQGKAYRWYVQGVRPDNNVFSATGQFAIAKP